MKLRFKIKTPNPAASMNRIAKITHYKSDLTTKLFELDYPTFDDNGNRTELVRTVFPFVDGRFGSGSKVNWEYDLTSQLSFERYFLANQTEFLTQEYLNDDAGNRETHNVNYFDQSRSVAGTYNAANELTGLEISSPSTSPTNVTFEHNKRGGRTKMTTNAGGSDSVVVNYGYNEDNSMTQYGVVAPGRQLNVAFAYSGGLRVEKQVTGFITTGGQQQVYNTHKKYLLDGVDVLLELQVIGSNTVVTALHIPGVLSATLIEGGASVVRYQLHDAQGNVVGLVDTDQEVGPVYLQDSWGIPLVDTDCQTVSLASSPIQVESVPNPYRWGGEHGYYADEDVGMYLMGYRWYDSFTGRFISRDPIGFDAGDMNLYRPMENNPVNEVDWLGLQPEPKLTIDPNLAYKNYNNGHFSAPCRVCHGVSASGFNGDVNSFYGVPGTGPNALEGYHTLRVISEILAPLLAPVVGEAAVAALGVRVVTVTHFTSRAGATAITRSGGMLRGGTYVTRPAQVRGLNSKQVETLLEIKPGRGAVSTSLETTSSNLATPAGGPVTSGGAVQHQLIRPTPTGPFTPTPPP